MNKLIKVCYPSTKRHWDGDPLFSYMGDCDIIMACSIRNIGKTFTVFKKLRGQINKGRNVAISRYDRIELAVTISDFLRYYEERGEDGELIKHYKKIPPPMAEMPIQIYEFENGARVYFYAIKDSPNLKGMEITNLSRWYIDEFVPIAYKFQTRKYKEFDYFVELYHTVLRSNTDLKIIMTANCKVWENPYFMGWEIPKFKSGYILKIERDGLRLAIENVGPSEAMAKAFIEGELKMGKTRDMVDMELKNYATDPDAFIQTTDNATDTGIQIKIKGNVYGLYSKRGLTYVKTEKYNQSKSGYLLTPIECDEHFVFDSTVAKTIEKMLNFNALRFDSHKTEFNVRLGIWLSKTRVI